MKSDNVFRAKATSRARNMNAIPTNLHANTSSSLAVATSTFFCLASFIFLLFCIVSCMRVCVTHAVIG